MSDQATCKTCRFWDPEYRDRKISYKGKCRRRAPVRMAAALPPQYCSGNEASFPETHELTWCGEHEQEEEQSAAVNSGGGE